MKVLLLGGTGEARRLAELVADWPGLTVVTSLAGRTGTPRLPPGAVRIGGFGGAAGLAQWLRTHEVTEVVDATHPFAARISASAVTASQQVGVPLLVLRRPAWQAEPDDDWHRVPSLDAAARALAGLGERVFLSTGRQGLASFAGLDRHWFLARCVEPPEPPTPARLAVLLDRGPFSLPGELDLLRGHRIDVLVSKDSGGPATAAKLVAARTLGLPVVLVDRPPTGTAATVSTVEAAADWLAGRLAAQAG
jgi:precorrin-6A/cobalt-precorrin-6A reductase